MADIELPRLVKKPGGAYRRVDTPAELDAALAEGWFVRLPPPTGIVLTDDAPRDIVLTDAPPASAPFPDVLDDPDGNPPDVVLDPPKRPRGRPRKVV